MYGRGLLIAGMLAAAGPGAAQIPTVSPGASPLFIGGGNPSETALFQGLLDEAFGTLKSAEFHTALKSLRTEYPAVYLRTNWGNVVTATVDEVSDLVGARGTYHYVQTPVALKGDTGMDSTPRVGDVTADSTWTESPGQEGSMTIGRDHLRRWRSADPVERSCAINTIAHETSHLVSVETARFVMAAQDFGSGMRSAVTPDGRWMPKPYAVASYLIGSVAQCSWLKKQPGYTGLNLRTCVEMFGDRGFNKNRCQSFAGGQPITFRPGLPDPHLLTD